MLEGQSTATTPIKAPEDNYTNRTVSSTGQNSLVILGKVNNLNCDFVIDTGSDISIIHPDMLPSDKQRDLCPTSGCSLRTVTGEKAPIRGTVELTLTLGTTRVAHKMWVADIQDSCILGMDFLEPHNCLINLGDRTLHIGDEEVPLKKPQQEDSRVCCRVILDQTVNLPPRSETLISVRVEGLQADVGRWGVLGPREETLATDGLLTGRTLVDLSQPTIPVRIMNLADGERKIKCGSVVAVCEPVQSVLTQQDVKGTPVTEASTDKELPEHLTDLFERSSVGLDSHQKGQLHSLLCDFASLFSTGAQDLGRTDQVQHRIHTGDATPIRQPARRLPPTKMKEAMKAVDDMYQEGIIEPSSSPWASPIVLVKKKDGSTCFCVDYRKLNQVTRKDSYPLPRIDDTLEGLAGAKWFSSLDLKSGYWQVGMHPDDREKTAFTAGRGLWQFCVMPFGLCNAPATFKRLMEQVLAGLPLSICLVYLDDILVPAQTFEDGISNLRTVFQRLQIASLKLSPQKCTLFQRQTKYLGHIVSGDGVATDGEKVHCILTWPRPTNVSEVRQFLGLCSYYRRFISNFADIAHPLYQCTEKSCNFHWTPETEQAFQNLKQLLTSAPVLGYPDPDGHLVLDTDASAHAIGAVLSQIQQGEERVLAYYSRALHKPELNYCTTRRELLAVVKSIEHFHHFLYGRRFTVRTDHAALKWLMNFRQPEGQVARWIERLQQYDFSIEHRPGSLHGNADALSRRPCLSDGCRHCDRLEEHLAPRNDDDSQPQVFKAEVLTFSFPEWSKNRLQDAQCQDEDIGPIVRWFKEESERPSWVEVTSCSPATKGYWAQWDSLCMRDGLVFKTLGDTCR